MESCDRKVCRLHLANMKREKGADVLEDRLIRERKMDAKFVALRALSRTRDDAPIPNKDFDTLLNVNRHKGITSYLEPEGPEGALGQFVLVPRFHSRVESYDLQLDPLPWAVDALKSCVPRWRSPIQQYICF